MAYATTNPYTGEVVKEFDTATEKDIQDAIAKADATFHTWKETSFEER